MSAKSPAHSHSQPLRFEEDCSQQGHVLIGELWQAASRLEFGEVRASARPAQLKLDSSGP